VSNAMKDQAPAVIEIKNLSKIYYRARRPWGGGIPITAVEGLDLTVGRAGSVHGFLGPNGSGKTTTIRCLLGLIRPTGGSVSVFGVDSTRQFHHVASRVGAIVENPKMFPNFSARRNLGLLARMAQIPSSEVERVLDVVGLKDRGDDSFASYSLGMKQRLAIAGALMKDPDLLILDEPANGLDPAGIAEIRVLVRQIADEGKAVLVSSHQLAEVEQMVDDITVIDHGRLVETGSLAHVRSMAGDDVVVVTIDQRDEAIAALAASGITAHPRADGREMSVDIEVARSSEITRALADRGLYLSGLRADRATLEKAFLTLTAAPPPTGPSLAGAPSPLAGAPPPLAPPPLAAPSGAPPSGAAPPGAPPGFAAPPPPAQHPRTVDAGEGER